MCGEDARQTLRGFGGCEYEYNFCDMARTLRTGENAFRRSCNFRGLGVVKKRTYCNLCVICLMVAFVPHWSNKYFQVMASIGIPFRKCRNVGLDSGMRTKADVC